MKNHYWDIGRSPPNTKDLLYGLNGLNGYYSISLGALSPKQDFKQKFMRKRAAKRFVAFSLLGVGVVSAGYMAYKKAK